MTTILLILLILTLIAVIAGTAFLHYALVSALRITSDHLAVVGNDVKVLNQRLDGFDDSFRILDGHVDEGAIMVRDTVNTRLDHVANQFDAVHEWVGKRTQEVLDSQIEVVTAITKAFMDETIEIKQGIEVLVSALSEPAAANTQTGPCQVKDCKADAALLVPFGKQEVAVCEPHAEQIAKQAMAQAPKKREKVLCEDGYDHSGDPDYVPGQIHAHVAIPDKAEFLAAEGMDGTPDTSVLTPEPMDDLSAAIERAYQEKKSQIEAALNQPVAKK